MARTLTTIFNESKAKRTEYLRLSEIDNPSKMSILDAITWVTSSCICIFENILDLFKVQIAEDISNKISGTPQYYVNALLKFQKCPSGQTQRGMIQMNAAGTALEYININEADRIIVHASYTETTDPSYFDKKLILKVAGGTTTSYTQISKADMNDVEDYLNLIAFAGTHFSVVSLKGDVLMPKAVIYYDGAIPTATMMANIKAALTSFTSSMEFNGIIYAQKVVDVLQAVKHVNDVRITGTYTPSGASPVELGVFISQYDNDDVAGIDIRIERYVFPNSGYIRESTGIGQEAGKPKWDQSIYLVVDNPTM